MRAVGWVRPYWRANWTIVSAGVPHTRLRPPRCSGLCICDTQERAARVRQSPYCTFAAKARVYQPFLKQHIQHSHHQGRVRPGTDRNPLGAQRLRRPGPTGIDDDHLDPSGSGLPDVGLCLAAHAGVGDIRAPQDNQVGELQGSRRQSLPANSPGQREQQSWPQPYYSCQWSRVKPPNIARNRFVRPPVLCNAPRQEPPPPR